MKALSDINGFDIKVHSNNIKKIFDCLYTWLSETLKINKQDAPLKTFYDYMDFNTNIFEEKVIQFGSDYLANDYIVNISISEFIEEIRERI